jgi:hypothetical protein
MDALIDTLVWDGRPTQLHYIRLENDLDADRTRLLETGRFAPFNISGRISPLETKVLYFSRGYWFPAFVVRFERGQRLLLHKAVGALSLRKSKRHVIVHHTYCLLQQTVEVPKKSRVEEEAIVVKATPEKTFLDEYEPYTQFMIMECVQMRARCHTREDFFTWFAVKYWEPSRVPHDKTYNIPDFASEDEVVQFLNKAVERYPKECSVFTNAA